ncbi:uncharacterized protein LOC111086614 [Limulus polyphemus]|uniref:Uncharacterized protein LOC111086614 n=1 Tax=Limulus polyphemus TaxID=6850 RepID=A0ABM1SQE7_LIMPO|nr:uncharacterized protein LOC111086614 [Limulus polyphemus]
MEASRMDFALAIPSSNTNARSYRGADVGSDHNLVIGKFKVKFKVQQKTKKPKAFAVNKLKDPRVAEEFQLKLRNKFEVLENLEDIETHWEGFKKKIREVAEEVLGRRRGTNRERWISDGTWTVIDERKRVKQLREAATRQDYGNLAERYNQLDREVKRRCKNDKNQWIEDKGNKAQEAADRGDSKTIYKITKELTSGFKSSEGVPIKAKNGTRLTTEREQLERWKEHFNEVLNQCEPDILLDLSNENVRAILNVNLNDISLEEARRALQNLKNNKAAGSDELQPELLKNGGQALELELLNIFNNI